MKYLTIVCMLISSLTLPVTAQTSDEIGGLIQQLQQLNRPQKTTIDSLNGIAHDYAKAYPALMVEFSARSIALAEELGYPEGEAQSYLNLATIYRTKGDVTKGLESGIQAFALYHELSDSVNMARCFNSIANCYKDLGRQDSSLSFLNKALALNTTDLKTRGNTLNNIGSTYIDLDQLDSAEKYYKASIELREEIRDVEGLGVTYGNLGIIAIQRDNDPELANYWYDKSIQMKIDNRDFFNLAFTYINKGNLHRNLGEFELARNNYQIAVDITDSINASGVKAAVYTRWARAERMAGNEGQALAYERTADKIYIEVLEERQASELNQLKAGYELARQRQQMIIQEKDIALLEKERSLLLFQFLLAVGVAGLLLGLFLLQRSKRKREKELQETHKAKLSAELENKTNELSLFTINFIQKQQMMDELNQLINEAGKEKNQEGIKKKLREITRVVSNQQRNDKEWEDFKVYFEKVHQNFFQKMQEEFEDITITELRLSALIKMNMNIKETASVLGIEPDSVKTARSRLRAKLGLSRDQNLANFLSTY